MSLCASSSIIIYYPLMLRHILFSTVVSPTTSALAALARYLYKPTAPPFFLFSSFVSSLIDNPIVQACLHSYCCAHASVD